MLSCETWWFVCGVWTMPWFMIVLGLSNPGQAPHFSCPMKWIPENSRFIIQVKEAWGPSLVYNDKTPYTTSNTTNTSFWNFQRRRPTISCLQRIWLKNSDIFWSKLICSLQFAWFLQKGYRQKSGKPGKNDFGYHLPSETKTNPYNNKKTVPTWSQNNIKYIKNK